MREEGFQRRKLLIFGVEPVRLEAAGGGHQFIEVLDTRLTAIGLLFLVVFDQA